MKICLYCGTELYKGLKYCSVAHQKKYEEQLKIAEWLETGIATVSSSHDHYIRKYIRAEQDSKCAICQLPDMWNEQPLTMVLDHIDGNSENNARGNLRLVCPNCDSQLSTYKSRNKGNGRHSRRQRYQEGKSY